MASDKKEVPWDYFLARSLYSGIIGNAALAYYGIQRFRQRLSPEAFAQRRGKFSLPAGRHPLWIHASSMGEMRVAAGLINALAALKPATEFICTASTETGFNLGLKIASANTVIVRAPVDLARIMRSFLEHYHPTALILIETEWWPNQMHACLSRGLPVFVANGRVSAKAGRRYLKVKRYLGPLLGRIERFYMRSAADAQRVQKMGVNPEKIEIAGSIKNDVSPEQLINRPGPPSGPPILLAGCTRPGEETILLAAFDLAREQVADLRLWLAPRHPERFGEVRDLLRKSGHRWAAYSVLPQKNLPTAGSPEVVLIDKMGVLSELYQQAHVAFVGGSLLPFGGHNPVEPIVAGAPVLFGPHTEEQAEAATGLLNHKLGRQVDDANSLAEAVVALCQSPPDPDDWQRRRREFFAQNKRIAEYVATDIFSRFERLRGAS